MTNAATAIVRGRGRFRHVSEANRHFVDRRLEAPELLLCPLRRSPTLSVALRSRSADGSAQPVSGARAPCRAFGAVLGNPQHLGAGVRHGEAVESGQEHRPEPEPVTVGIAAGLA